MYVFVSTPLAQQAPNSARSIVEEDRGMRLPMFAGEREMGIDNKADAKVTHTDEPSTNDTRDISPRVTFDFIQNPLKKAFFEGTSTSPRMQSIVSSSSQCSNGLDGFSKIGVNHAGYEMANHGEQMNRTVISKRFV